MGFLKAKVRLKDDFKIMALFDTGAEINVMIKEVIKNARLVLKQGLKLELVLHIGHSRPFLGLYKYIEIAKRGLKIKHPIFIIEARDHNLVLR